MTDKEWISEMGLCHKCRKERVAPGRKHCFDCLERMREDSAARYDSEAAKAYQSRRREIYQQKKVAGICVRCSRPASHGMYCYECSIKVKRHNMATAIRRKNIRHDNGLIPEKRKAEGKCLWCGESVIPGLQCCEVHRRIFYEAGKKAYEANVINGNNVWINEVMAWKKKNGWKISENI